MQEGEGPGPDEGIAAGTRQSIPFRPARPTDPADRPPICRFLAREGPDGTLGPASPTIDPAHRCVALDEPLPQSARQQELVCLTGAHASCPRFLRGMLTVTPPAPPAREPVSRAVVVAALIFVAAVAASFGFLAVRGGFSFASASTTAAPSEVGVVPPSPASLPSVAASPIPTAPSPSPSPEPTPSPSPEPTPTPVTTPSPTPGRTPAPAPSSDRFAVLTKCPSTPDCWIYVIRSGDNLVSIAHYFGVDYGRMRAMNPNLRVPIQAGDDLRIPTPTR